MYTYTWFFAEKIKRRSARYRTLYHLRLAERRAHLLSINFNFPSQADSLGVSRAYLLKACPLLRKTRTGLIRCFYMCRGRFPRLGKFFQHDFGDISAQGESAGLHGMVKEIFFWTLWFILTKIFVAVLICNASTMSCCWSVRLIC